MQILLSCRIQWIVLCQPICSVGRVRSICKNKMEEEVEVVVVVVFRGVNGICREGFDKHTLSQKKQTFAHSEGTIDILSHFA